MQWKDEGFLLSKNNYSENSVIIEVFTLNHGKCPGIVYGGTSRKIKNYLQLGNKIYCKGKPSNCNFQYQWPKQDTFNFTRKRICEMQSLLKKYKASDETPDGLFGGKTRRGIGTFEAKNNLPKTCFPTKKLLKVLRQK